MRKYVVWSVLFLFLVSGVFALSFSTGPSVYSVVNVTTADPFTCRFTPVGTGVLTANVTWFQDGSAYTADDQSFSVTTGVLAESNPVTTTATTKDEVWLCQVTVYNATNTTRANASSITIENTKPEIDTPAQLIFYEDTAVTFTFTATDADNDTMLWTALDVDSGLYSGNSLFSVLGNGTATIDESTEDLVGNHTMQISAFDDLPYGSTRFIEFQLIATNDAPIYTAGTLNYTCNEAVTCAGAIGATDEDNATAQLTFTFNDTFINASSNGTFTFIPTYAQALTQNYSIQVNVTDGNSVTTSYLNITINTQNHAPNISYVNVSGTQNDTLFTFLFNVTDTLDPLDAFNFSVTSDCGVSPWSIENYSNGLGGATATGMINTSLFSNNYVVCRDIIISVFEIDTSSGSPRETYTYNVSLNITNINDAPQLNELNYDEVQSNMSALTAALGLSFNYTVNATDVDMDTYQGDNLTYALASVPTFSNGSDMFQINASTGFVSSVQNQMNATYTGSQNFTVLVFDSLSPQYNDSRNLTVVISVNYVPEIYALNTSACAESFVCTKYLAANDTEGEAVSLTITNLSVTDPLSVTTVYTNATEIETMLGLNTSAGVFSNNVTNFTLNFTPDDIDRGDYVLAFVFTDPVGNTNASTLSFTVTNTLEAPQFDDDADHAIIDPVTFTNFYESIEYDKLIYLLDDDLTFQTENITLSYVFNGNISPLGFSITQVNNSLARINYTSNNAQSGTYTVNLTLTDTAAMSTTQTVVFTIQDTSTFPSIDSVRPYYNTTTNTTVTSGLITLNATENSTAVTVAENDTVIFDLRASDTDNMSMTVSWYVNGTLNTSAAYTAASPDVDYTRTFTFFEEGTFNITARVSDIGYTDFSWIVTVNDTNRPPQFVHSARNLTGASAIQGSASILFTNFFFLNWDDNKVFYDPDDDLNSDGEINLSGVERNNLSFAINTSGSCDELANFVFNGVDDNLTVTPVGSGTCSTNFIATDRYGVNVSSNTLQIQIVQTESSSSDSSSTSSRTRTVTETVTVPVEDPVADPTEFDILHPGVTVMYANGTAIIPVTIRNNWDSDLVGVTLRANNSVEGFSYSFDTDYFALIPKNQEVRTNLSIVGYRISSPFSFNISAYVGSLQYTDYETIHVNALEKGQEDLNSLKSRIGFARDLLTDNPECGELLEVLDAAEKNPNTVDFEIINNVISGCKYLINGNSNRTDAFPKSFSGKLSVYGKTVVDYNLLFIIIGSLLAVSLIIGLAVKFTLKKI